MNDFVTSPKGILAIVLGLILGVCVGWPLLRGSSEIKDPLKKNEEIIHTIGAALAVDMGEAKKEGDVIRVDAPYDVGQIDWPRIQHNIRWGSEEAVFLDSGDRRELVRRLDNALAADERNGGHKNFQEWCERVCKVYASLYKNAVMKWVELKTGKKLVEPPAQVLKEPTKP